MKPRTSMLIGVGLVLISVCCVQLGSVVGKSTFDRADPASVTFGRLAIAAAVLLLVARPNLLAFRGRTWAWMLLLGATMAGMNFTFYLAIERIPVGVAVTIELIGPLTVSLVQSKRFRELIWVLIALLGIVLIGLQSFRGVIDPVGILLAAFAGVCWGAYIIASKQVGQRVAGLKGLAIALMVSAIVVLPFAIVPFVRDVSADPTVLLPMGLIALLSSLLAYGVELVALRRIPTRVFGVMMALEPAVAAAFAVLLLHEAVGGLEIVAIALVMIASAGVAYTAAPKADPIVTGTFGTIVPAHESFDVATCPIDIIEQFDDDDPQNIDPNDELT